MILPLQSSNLLDLPTFKYVMKTILLLFSIVSAYFSFGQLLPTQSDLTSPKEPVRNIFISCWYPLDGTKDKSYFAEIEFMYDHFFQYKSGIIFLDGKKEDTLVSASYTGRWFMENDNTVCLLHNSVIDTLKYNSIIALKWVDYGVSVSGDMIFQRKLRTGSKMEPQIIQKRIPLPVMFKSLRDLRVL